MIITMINQHANNFGDESACIGVLIKLFKNEHVEKVNLIYIGQGEIHLKNEKLEHNREVNVKNIGIKQVLIRLIAKYVGYDYRGNAYLDNYLKIIEQSDVVFVSPAGADIGHYKGWAALVNLYLVDSCNKKIIFHLNTIEKSGNLLFDYLSKRILKKSIIYVREKKSYHYLKSINIKSVFGVDSAFLLPNDNVISEKNLITFIPTQLETWNNNYKNIDEKVYNNIIKSVFDFAVNHSMKLVLLQHLGTKQEMEYYKSIINRYGQNKYITIANEIDNAFDYQHQICKSKFVVSMRYHGVVISAKNAIPFISIEYENKMKEVCSYVGFEKQNIKVTNSTYDNMTDMLKKTMEQEKSIRENLKKNVKNLYKTAERPIEQNVKK